MAIQASFEPNFGSGITVAPGAVSGSSTIGRGSKAIVVTNLSNSVVSYVRIGPSGITATSADYPLLPLTQISLSKAMDHDTVAYVTASGAGSLHIIPGEGY